MNTCRSVESLKSQIEHARSKLLGQSHHYTEVKDCEEGDSDPNKEYRDCAHEHSDSENEKTWCKEAKNLHCEEQDAQNSGLGCLSPTKQGKQEEINTRAAGTNQFVFSVCHVEKKENTVGVSRTKTGTFLTAVDVALSGPQQCDPCVTINKKDSAQDTQQHSESSCVSSYRQIEGYTSKSTQKLSKSPISVITYNTANNMFCTRGDTISNKEPHIDSMDPVLSITPDVSSFSNIRPGAKTAASLKTSGKDDTLEVTVSEQERPTVRRRLSKTIQNLQEKIQKEIENNENKSGKSDDAKVKSLDSKRLSIRGNGRFVRERSRKRSKSRVGFKVLQSVRKHQPVVTRERPYRQWMGVGSCVTHDSRFIVASNCSNGKQRLAKQEFLTKNENADGSNDLPDDKSHEGKECILADIGDERKEQSKASVTDCGIKEEKSIPQKPSADGDNAAKNVNPQSSFLVHCNAKESEAGEIKKTDHLEKVTEPCSIASALTQANPSSLNTSKDGELCSRLSLRSSSPTRDRSRCIKRSSLCTEKRRRPPTPHSNLSSGNVKNSKLQFGKNSSRVASRKRIVHGTENSQDHMVSVSKTFEAPVALKKECPGKSSGHMPFESEFNDVMRNSKLFTAAKKQQRKPALLAYTRKENEGTRSIHADKNAAIDATQTSPCDRNSVASEDSGHRGSEETLWSDVSTTTWESSIKTESSSSWYQRDVSASHDEASLNFPHSKSLPKELLIGSKAAVSKRISETGRRDKDLLTGKYINVQAVVGFKGMLPGQLNFREGQIIKQMVSPSPVSTDAMSYGYYRAGPFKRKKKGLFPSTCVIPMCQ